ncbi:TRIM71 [Mytilus edulis]|uniref:TRIM71 n=1 Tax=Mytilus edulis TaxID=6550 RepID=A0A8S3SLT7_MYTED|nr:TRIM71 [Mytilus edulis]
MEYILNSKLEILKSLQSSAGGEIFAFEQQVMNYQIPCVSENIIPRKNIKYLERSTSEETISTLFGSMYLLDVPYTMDITIDRSLNTNYSNIENLVVSEGEIAWVSTFENNKASVQKIHLAEMLGTVKQLDLHAFDVAFSENNDLIISIESTSEIMRVSINSIHVAKNGDLYVGIRESGDPFEITESSCRKILVYKSSGGKLTSNVSYEFDKSKQRLFTSPCRITTLSDGDIVIVGDWITHIEGRLVALNRNGDLEWTYNGNSKINSDTSKFRPYDIVSSPEGYIVVADKNNHALHLLNGAGELIACKLLDEIGITLPKALCFDFSGYLWIGCSTFPEDKSGANIYAVKLGI